MIDLSKICHDAVETGRTIDITGCHYGLHKRTGQYLGETFYYSFLAGFARSQQLRRILEVGTHYGGSIMALSRGACSNGETAGREIVTMDKTFLNPEGFAAFPHIRRLQGDSLKPEIVQKTCALFHPPIDLLYIDSKHTYEHVKGNIDLYGVALKPAFIILDDIHHNESMEKIWQELAAAWPHFDASHLAQRPAGFGVLRYRADAGALPAH